MNKPKVMLLSCGDSVYPNKWLNDYCEEIVNGLKKTDIDLAGTHLILNETTVNPAREALKKTDFDVIIVHFVSWHISGYITNIIRDYKDVPILVWATGGKTDNSGKLHSPAAPAGITAFLPTLREMAFKHKAIYEKPDEPHRFKDVEQFAKTAQTYSRIKNSRVGLIGYADMGLYSCAYDRTSVFSKLGIDVEDYFSYEIGELMSKVSPDEIKDIVSGIESKFNFENEISKKVLDKVARLYYALKTKVGERGLDAISIKCVQGVTKYMGVNPCMAQSLLANKDLSVICECDAHGLITNMMMSMLTSGTAGFMENYEFFDDTILVGTCGFLPIDFADGTLKARSTNLGDFFVGMSNVSKVKTGVVTFARLYREVDKYKMFISRGEAKSPLKWIELGWEEPTPDFPSLLIKLEIPVQTYMEKVPGQHIIISYGDCVEQLEDLCALMDIEVVK
jgi:L-fucose isomerase-like protein